MRRMGVLIAGYFAVGATLSFGLPSIAPYLPSWGVRLASVLFEPTFVALFGRF